MAKSPTNCPDRDTLFNFSVGNLPAALREEVAGHISGCAACVAILESLDECADPMLAHLRQPLPSTALLDPDRTNWETVPARPATADAARPAWARYRVLRFHARGGLGEVHLALDAELGREVALKQIREQWADDEDSRRRFLQEAEVTGKLEHPGVVPVYGLVSGPDGRPYYAMRFIQGPSLKDAIERFHEQDSKPGRDPGERSLAQRQLLGRFVAVCNTLAYAHSRGVIHRDIKPANVMLGKYGETLVVDWGLAKPFARGATERASGEETLTPASGSTEEGITQVGQALGTPAYMSPEQAAGRWHEVGPASDLFSLGATLYTLLTGLAPYQGALDAVLDQARGGDFAPPRHVNGTVPPALEAVCQKAMARKPGDRYATALELAADIEHWLADEPVTAWREPLRLRLGRWSRRNRALVAGFAATFLVVLVGRGSSAGGIKRSRPARPPSRSNATKNGHCAWRGWNRTRMGLCGRQPPWPTGR